MQKQATKAPPSVQPARQGSDRQITAASEQTEDVVEVSGRSYRFVKRLTMERWRPRFISDSDIRAYAMFPIYRLSAHTGRRVRALLGRMPLARMRGRLRRSRRGMALVLGENHPRLDEACRKLRAGSTRRFIYYVLERSRGYAPDFTLVGREHVDAALARGRGAIIWAENVLFQTHAGKRGLHDAGLPVHQLSTPGHGASNSLIGKRWLNRWQVAVENKHVDGWIIFDPHGSEDVRPRIEALLADNKVIMITNNAHAGRRFVDVPLAPGAEHRIATGPMTLALKTGAALLPCATSEAVPLEKYVVEVGEDIVPADLRASPDVTDRTGLARIADGYRGWLVDFLGRHPEEWMNWSFLKSREERLSAEGNGAERESTD